MSSLQGGEFFMSATVTLQYSEKTHTNNTILAAKQSMHHNYSSYKLRNSNYTSDPKPNSRTVALFVWKPA